MTPSNHVMLKRTLVSRRHVLLLITLAFLIEERNIAAQKNDSAVPTLSLPVCGKLPKPLDRLGCAVVGKRLYVFGGRSPQGFNKDAWSAEIGEGGKLSSWRSEAPLPQYRQYISNSVQVINGRIYIMGGLVMKGQKASEDSAVRAIDCLWSNVREDGTLDPWKTSRPVSTLSGSNPATCASENSLFIVGGSAGAISPAVFCGTVGVTGEPDNWRRIGTLPMPLWFHGAAVMDGNLYVWGGLTENDNSKINSRVISAPIKADSTLGPWKDEQPMEAPIYSSGFCGFNDYLICAAGRYINGHTTNVVWYSHLTGRRPGPWSMIKTNLETRTYHAVGLDKVHGWVFVVGGQFRAGVQLGEPHHLIDVVQGFKLPQAPSSTLIESDLAAAAASNIRFRKLPQALSDSALSKRRILAFFYSPQVPAAKRLYDELIASPEFAQAIQTVELAQVDATTREISFCYKYKVFQIPSFALLNSDGSLVKTSGRLYGMEDLSKFLEE